MKPLHTRWTIAMLLAGIMLVATVYAVLAVSGSWDKNGSNMSGYHDTQWIQPLDRKIWGSSNARTPRGVIEYIYVDLREKDRCRNPDGTWQPWYQYAFDNHGEWWAYGTGTIDAQGTYQNNCFYGHEYRNESLHRFLDGGFGLNAYKWLYSQ